MQFTTAYDDQTCRLNLEALRSQVDSWFSSGSLEAVLAPVENQTEKIALEWMAKAGKRWRPFLTACAYRALVENQPPHQLSLGGKSDSELRESNFVGRSMVPDESGCNSGGMFSQGLFNSR